MFRKTYLLILIYPCQYSGRIVVSLRKPEILELFSVYSGESRLVKRQGIPEGNRHSTYHAIFGEQYRRQILEEFKLI